MTIAKAYGLGMTSVYDKKIDWDSDTIKCMLTTSSYVPNQDTHQYKSSVTNEVTGTGYSAGGTTLTGKTVGYTSGTKTLKLSADNPTWASLTVTGIRIAVFYVDTGSSATSPVLCYMDFESNFSPSAQAFSITLPSLGILSATVA